MNCFGIIIFYITIALINLRNLWKILLINVGHWYSIVLKGFANCWLIGWLVGRMVRERIAKVLGDAVASGPRIIGRATAEGAISANHVKSGRPLCALYPGCRLRYINEISRVQHWPKSEARLYPTTNIYKIQLRYAMVYSWLSTSLYQGLSTILEYSSYFSGIYNVEYCLDIESIRDRGNFSGVIFKWWKFVWNWYW